MQGVNVIRVSGDRSQRWRVRWTLFPSNRLRPIWMERGGPPP